MPPKLPFSAFFLNVLQMGVKKHGKDKPLTLGHLLGIVKLAMKLHRKHNAMVDRLEAEEHAKLLEESSNYN